MTFEYTGGTTMEQQYQNFNPFFPRRSSIKEAAKLLSLSDRMVRHLIALPSSHPDYLPAERIGSRILLNPKTVEEWLERHAISGTTG
jgi:excisionase family DNA binding protein